MRAVRVLGLDKDMKHVAWDDTLGRKLQDLKLVAPLPSLSINGKESQR